MGNGIHLRILTTESLPSVSGLSLWPSLECFFVCLAVTRGHGGVLRDHGKKSTKCTAVVFCYFASMIT